MFIVKYKAFFITVSALLVVLSFISFATFGLKQGIDFTGGTIIEAAYGTQIPPVLDTVALKKAEIQAFQIDGGYKFVSSLPYAEMTSKLSPIANVGTAKYIEKQVNTVGPTLGAEMKRKATIAIAVVVLAILAFIAFSFRGVSHRVSSWKYGVIAMVTLMHDIIIAAGAYTLLSHFHGAEVDTLFVIALLTVMAVTISDKIVVFDRIRENLKVSKNKTFDEIVGISLSQTIVRSINTSLTTVLALTALFFFGPSATKFFSLTLMVGIIVGTYSSICVASTLLTVWNLKK
jgi:preprotein translocase subunit SecF